MVKPRPPGRAASETGHRFAKPTSGRPACKSGTMLAGQHAAGLVIPAEATPSESLGDPARVATPCGSEPPAGHKRHSRCRYFLSRFPGITPVDTPTAPAIVPSSVCRTYGGGAPAQRPARSDCGAGTFAEARDPPAPASIASGGCANPESCFDLGVGADGQRSTVLVKTTRHWLGARGSGGPRGRGCRRPNALIDRTWWAAGRLGSR